jgi:hypothetical protein
MRYQITNQNWYEPIREPIKFKSKFPKLPQELFLLEKNWSNLIFSYIIVRVSAAHMHTNHLFNNSLLLIFVVVVVVSLLFWIIYYDWKNYLHAISFIFYSICFISIRYNFVFLVFLFIITTKWSPLKYYIRIDGLNQ